MTSFVGSTDVPIAVSLGAPGGAGFGGVGGIGLADQFGPHQFRGLIAELIVYDRVLSEPEWQDVERRLRARYPVY